MYRLKQVHYSSMRDGEPETNFLDKKLVMLVGELFLYTIINKYAQEIYAQ